SKRHQVRNSIQAVPSHLKSPHLSHQEVNQILFKVDETSFQLLKQRTSIGKRADPNSVRPGTRPIGRYTGRVSGWECCHPLRIGLSSVELTCMPSAARAD